MKYYIIAGEVSGDLQGSNVVREISKLDNDAVFRGIGGDKLQEAGVKLLFGLDRLSFMGFYEVLRHLRTIRLNFSEVKTDILSFKPDVVILVDYPGFNLRMAKWCKKHDFKVVYYISPKIWAWNEGRVEQIKRYVDMMLCILPFEVLFYKKHRYFHAQYVGHPLLDFIDPSAVSKYDKSVIALLPGSRQQELKNLLPVLLDTAISFPNEQFVITGISRLKDLYPTELPSNVKIIFDKTYEVLQHSKAAIVCSGTATLETALFRVPQVVIYKTSWLNYQIGKRLAKVHFISLPNLIAEEKIVEELIQQDCSTEKIAEQLTRLLNMNPVDYNKLMEKIGESGAAQRAAKLITAHT
ncbi:MAG: lipid-A-disaccharide synthase [Chitinophagales bacterium]